MGTATGKAGGVMMGFDFSMGYFEHAGGFTFEDQDDPFSEIYSKYRWCMGKLSQGSIGLSGVPYGPAGITGRIMEPVTSKCQEEVIFTLHGFLDWCLFGMEGQTGPITIKIPERRTAETMGATR